MTDTEFEIELTTRTKSPKTDVKSAQLLKTLLADRKIEAYSVTADDTMSGSGILAVVLGSSVIAEFIRSLFVFFKKQPNSSLRIRFQNGSEIEVNNISESEIDEYIRKFQLAAKK